MGGGWSTPHPSHFTPCKDPAPSYRRLGGSHRWSGQVERISPTLEINLRTFHTIASHYTNYIIPAPTLYYMVTVTPGPPMITFEERSTKRFPGVAAGHRKMDHEHNSNTMQ